MELIDYINRGGTLVYVLIGLNIIGFSIIFFKAIVLFNTKKNLELVSNNIMNTIDITSKNIIKSVETKIDKQIKKLEWGLNTIKIIASISPLLGLLGTVVGVLGAFDAISKSGLGDPTIFSHGISIALITTVAGLIVAIPHYIGYNYFIGVLDNIEIDLEENILSKI